MFNLCLASEVPARLRYRGVVRGAISKYHRAICDCVISSYTSIRIRSGVANVRLGNPCFVQSMPPCVGWTKERWSEAASKIQATGISCATNGQIRNAVRYTSDPLVVAAAAAAATQVGPRMSMSVASMCFGGGMMIGGLGVHLHRFVLISPLSPSLVSSIYPWQVGEQ